MNDLNRVTIIGRLTADPELRTSTAGLAICRLRVAVNDSVKDAAGQWQDKAGFYDVTVFAAAADRCAQYLVKGKRVAVDGRLAWREWQADDGSKRQAVGIIAAQVHFLSPKDGDGQSAAATQTNTAPASAAAPSADFDDDDIPF